MRAGRNSTILFLLPLLLQVLAAEWRPIFKTIMMEDLQPHLLIPWGRNENLLPTQALKANQPDT
jgi:hypothetical protein